MRLSASSRRLTAIAGQRGIGLVELMIGITIGLIVAAGASMVAVRQISEHRRLMLEVQIQQDLRVAADLLQQDLRRAGYRGLPANGVWEPAHGLGSSSGALPKDALPNPYDTLTQTVTNGSDISYQYARNLTGTTAMNVSNAVRDNEHSGFRLVNKTLFTQLGLDGNGQPNWQPITDPDAVLIEEFTVRIDTQQIPLDDVCDCTGGVVCPTQDVRRVTFTLVGVAKSDATLRRSLTVSEKIRADEMPGACPA